MVLMQQQSQSVGSRATNMHMYIGIGNKAIFSKYGLIFAYDEFVFIAFDG